MKIVHISSVHEFVKPISTLTNKHERCAVMVANQLSVDEKKAIEKFKSRLKSIEHKKLKLGI